MPKGIRRVHALKNTFSGVAGEARVAAELVRCGFRVARPYWTDDEVDLLVLERTQIAGVNVAVPVLIQVKSVQFLPDKRDQKMPAHAFIQGLRKRYVIKSPAFALAIYRVDTDAIFFIHGPMNVSKVYDSQKSWNKRHTPFESLADDDDVRIAVHEQNGIEGDWEVKRLDADWLSSRVKAIASEVAINNGIGLAIDALWNDAPVIVERAEEELS